MLRFFITYFVVGVTFLWWENAWSFSSSMHDRWTAVQLAVCVQAGI